MSSQIDPMALRVLSLADPNSTSLNESSTPPESCCTSLRCKSMYYRDDERPGKLHWSDSQVYWCIHTYDAAGPDRGAATPKVCQAGRSCYQGTY